MILFYIYSLSRHNELRKTTENQVDFKTNSQFILFIY